MTDVEKAEEYYEDNECYSYLSEVEDFEEVFGFVKDRVKQAYLDGLAEGRKESKEYITWLKRQRQGGIQKQFNKANKIKSLEKENAELKEQLEELKLKNETLNELFDDFQRFFDKLRCCENCKHSYTDSENVVFCYLPFPQENCKSCKLYKHKDTDNDYWELAE